MLLLKTELPKQFQNTLQPKYKKTTSKEDETQEDDVSLEGRIFAFSNWPYRTASSSTLTKTGKVSKSIKPGQTVDAVLRQPNALLGKSVGVAERGRQILDVTALAKISPMFLEVVDDIVKVAREQLRRHEQDPGKPIGCKQFIFIDVSGSARQNRYGIRMLETLLEYKGYTNVNCAQTPADYRGMIVVGQGNREWAQRLAEDFNKPSNSTGKEAAIFLADGSVREGLNLKQVSNVKIVGPVKSRANLIQAVARAFRLCSSDKEDFVPGQGWTINVDIYTPYLHDTQQLHPVELLRAFDPTLEGLDELDEEIQELAIECAFDRFLLANINDASKSILDRLQLWPSRDVISRNVYDKTWLVEQTRQTKAAGGNKEMQTFLTALRKMISK
jgi:hypothetical protein